MIDFKALKIDALLVSHPPNVRYLTGYTGSNGMALLTPGRLVLFTDPRYDLRAREEVKKAKLPTQVKIVKKPLWEGAARHIERKSLTRVGFEEAHVPYAVYRSMDKALPVGFSLRPVASGIEELRMVKSPGEVELIRRSVLTNSEAFTAVVANLRPGITEADLAADLEREMRRRGADGPAFATIVSSGERTAHVHAAPTRKAIANSELVLIDMGSAQEGYMSDMTRMLFLGRPSQAIHEMYASVLDAQQAAIAAVREGVTTRYVDRAARDRLRQAGLGKQFVHSTGHGLGLEIHEAPKVGAKDKTRLKAGMVITIEPGAYVKGFGGMRVEDTVLVAKHGCEVLTPTSKELMVL